MSWVRSLLPVIRLSCAAFLLRTRLNVFLTVPTVIPHLWAISAIVNSCSLSSIIWYSRSEYCAQLLLQRELRERPFGHPVSSAVLTGRFDHYVLAFECCLVALLRDVGGDSAHEVSLTFPGLAFP